MSVRKKSGLVIALGLLLASCSPNLPTSQLPFGNNDLIGEKLSFGLKYFNRVENTNNNITFGGPWTVTNDSTSSGGSISYSNSGILDDLDANLKYYGPWDKTNIAAEAVKGTFATNPGGLFTLAENLNLSLRYSGNGWNHANDYSSNIITAANYTYSHNDSSIVYSGSWTNNTTYKTNLSGVGYAEISFTGTNFRIRGYKGPNRGKVNVLVYNSLNQLVTSLTNIDLYSASQTSSTIANIGGLAHGSYKVKIEGNGSKNNLSSGFRFDLINYLSFPAVEYNFNSSNIQLNAYKHADGGKVTVFLDGVEKGTISLYSLFSGTARLTEFFGLSPGKHRITMQATDQTAAPSGQNQINLDNFKARPGVSGSFSGTWQDFHFITAPNNGRMNLYIDGVLNQTVELYSPVQAYKSVKVSGLTNSEHRFDLIATGGKNASSSDIRVSFDGLIRSKASYTFNDRQICIVANKRSDQGMMNVFIDGVFVGTADLYSQYAKKKGVVFSQTVLPLGEHTIEIKPAGRKNPLSTSYSINLDSFDSLERAPINDGQLINFSLGNERKGFTFTGLAGQVKTIRMSKGMDNPNGNPYLRLYAPNGTLLTSNDDFGGNSDSLINSFVLPANGEYTIEAASAGDSLPGNYSVYLVNLPPIDEFQVNTYTTGIQDYSSVAMDADGDFVITWTSSGQDGSSNGIYAQRYTANGTPVGNEFKVNTYTTNYQTAPSVAMDADGDFIITWNSLFQDGSFNEVYAQRYTSTGSAIGSEFRVNTYTTGNQSEPSVAMDADGDFVITWQSEKYGFGNGIYAQRYTSTGSVIGSEFMVNTYTTGYLQSSPDLAMDADGDFVITWHSEQDGSGNGIYAQRYTANGTPVGNEFRVNTYTTNSQSEPSVAMDADGDFVITWTSSGQDLFSNGQDGSGTGVYAQRYTSTGSINGSEFQVNTYTTNSQSKPSVAMDTDGGFVITWKSYDYGSGHGIYAQRYTSTGSINGSEFQVNIYTNDTQTLPSVVMDAGGDFVITWTSSGQDGYSSGVYARRFSK